MYEKWYESEIRVKGNLATAKAGGHCRETMTGSLILLSGINPREVRIVNIYSLEPQDSDETTGNGRQ